MTGLVAAAAIGITLISGTLSCLYVFKKVWLDVD